MHSLLKLPLLLLSLFTARICLTQPAAATRPEKEEKAPSVSLEILLDPNFAWFRQVVYSGIIAIEALLVVVSNALYYFPIPLAQHLGPSLDSWGEIQVTPLFCAFLAVALLGTFIRWSAYNSLGRLFTYEMSVRKDHELVTGGPYAWVRHPGYTGLFLFYIGTGGCITTKGSWLREAGILDTRAGQALAAFFFLSEVGVAIGLCMRMKMEDDAMRMTFGKKWDRWARLVRWKLIWGIF